jgi:hypothetical protein
MRRKELSSDDRINENRLVNNDHWNYTDVNTLGGRIQRNQFVKDGLDGPVSAKSLC